MGVTINTDWTVAVSEEITTKKQEDVRLPWSSLPSPARTRTHRLS